MTTYKEIREVEVWACVSGLIEQELGIRQIRRSAAMIAERAAYR
jgi:hypothetical protein